MILLPSLPLLQPLLDTLKKAVLFIKNIRQSVRKRTTSFLISAKTWVTSSRPMRICKLVLEKTKRKLKQLTKQLLKNLNRLINKLWTEFSPSVVWNKWKLNYEKLLSIIRHLSSVLYIQTSLLCEKLFKMSKNKLEQSKTKLKSSENGKDVN